MPNWGHPPLTPPVKGGELRRCHTKLLGFSKIIPPPIARGGQGGEGRHCTQAPMRNTQMVEDTDTILRVESLTKSFGTNIANDGISFDLERGEILCLLGENGAGKSTLCKCLYGAYRPDAGRIYINGRRARLRSPKDAIQQGIGMVHQHFVLAPPMTVMENIMVGNEMPGFFVDFKAARQTVSDLCRKYELAIDLDQRVMDLSVGQQQWVEILKSLHSGVDILILDEPTAALTPQETERLLGIVQQMAAEGLSVILITHKLQEVMAVADRVTVLRKGRVVATRPTAEVDQRELARLMVGRDVVFNVVKEAHSPGETVLALDSLTVRTDTGKETLCDFSLNIHRHEILGIAGVSGNGQSELFDVIAGVIDPHQGKVAFKGEDITPLTPGIRSQKGMAFIPPDRIQQGLLMGCSLAENLILGFHNDTKFKTCRLLNAQKLNANASKSIDCFDITSTGPGQTAAELSGGNLQKVILARELSQKVDLVIASSPTRGLDVGAIEYVHSLLVNLRNEGAGVLLISEDLDEVLNLSDRIAVICKGRIMDIIPTGEENRERIGLLMAGIEDGNQCRLE